MILFLLIARPLCAQSAKKDIPAEKINTEYKPKKASKSATSKRFFILPEYKILHSTHGDNFSGGDVVFAYKVSRSLFLGLGTGFAYNKYHGDNGWELFSLRFLPVFADAKLFLPGNENIAPFFQLSEGVSMNHYRRKNYPYKTAYRVSERGDYLYAGVGCILKISKFLKPVIGIGFNGFRMSFNSFDVNPHGFTFRIGLLI